MRRVLLLLAAGSGVLVANAIAADPDRAPAVAWAAADGGMSQRIPAEASAFDSYRHFDPSPAAADWRAANDEVGRLGGFLGHMRPPPGEGTADRRDDR